MEESWLAVEVAKRTNEADGIVSIVLAAVDGSPLPPFSAGSHVDLETPSGLVRQYSLCNASNEVGSYRLGILLDPASRGGSTSVHKQVDVGTRLRISRPKNHFALSPAKHSLLLAGGIGVTPILAMAEELALQDASFEFHYCCRTLSKTAFRERLLKSSYSSRIRFHFDDGPADQRLDIEATLAGRSSDTHLYVCGPKGFMDAVIESAKRLGWPSANVHFEYFTATPPSEEGAAFDVVLARSGKVVTVPEGVTVIAALAQHGVDVPVSCEQGVCGTCVTRVLDGLPDHRDLYMTDEEHAKNDQFTPCCPRSRTPRLVLDL